ncbi:MAG: phosphotransferase [Acidimicrobiales bacterium]
MAVGKPFDEQTKLGRSRLLRVVAAEVLRDGYGIVADRLPLMSLSFNTLFRVERAGRAPLVVRVGGRPRIHADGVEEIESWWLRAIDRDLGLGVPQPVPALSGGFAAIGRHERIPRPVVCSVFTWVAGSRVPEPLGAGDAARLGGILAELHEHAASLDVRSLDPAAIDAVRADRVFPFGDRDEVLAHTAGTADGRMVAEAIDRGRQFLDDLWAQAPSAPHLLHGDFGPSNVLRRRSMLVPVDFQDLQLGVASQDVGLTLADLAGDGVDATVRDSFVAGYRGRRTLDLDAEQIAAFAALRSLSLIGFLVRVRHPALTSSVADEMRVVRAWMGGTSTG